VTSTETGGAIVDAKRRFDADRIALVRTRRRVLRNWRCASDARRADGAKAALAQFIGLRLGVLMKRAALLLQNLQVVGESCAPLGLVDLVFSCHWVSLCRRQK
jgi:hypothetical protein